jgi:hypothetical protein
MVASPFGRCPLYRCTLKDKLPGGCPLACDNPGEALRQIKDKSFWTGRGDMRRAVDAAHVYETCCSCLGRLTRHRHGRRFLNWTD